MQGRLRERLAAAVGEEEAAEVLAPPAALDPAAPHRLEEMLLCPISQAAPFLTSAPIPACPPAGSLPVCLHADSAARRAVNLIRYAAGRFQNCIERMSASPS